MRLFLIIFLLCIQTIGFTQSIPADTNKVVNLPGTNWFYVHRNKLIKISDSLTVLSFQRIKINTQKNYINYLEKTLDTCKQDLTVTNTALISADTSIQSCSKTLEQTTNKLNRLQKQLKFFKTLAIGSSSAVILFIIGLAEIK